METIRRRSERNDNFMESFGGEDLIEDFIASKKYSKDTQTYLSQTPMYYYLEMMAPGFKSEDFDISVKEHIINVRLKSQASKNKSETKEAFEGDRKFKLPDDAEPVKTSAKYDDNKLMILIPKANQFAAERPVHVKVE